MSRCGVILCECNGAVERRISLQDLNYFLHQVAPDLDIVLSNNLCKPRELRLLLEKSEVYPSVIGACDKISGQVHFWQDIDADKVNPCFTKLTNILSEIDSEFSDIEVAARIKLILGSQILKAFCCSDLSQDNIKLCFPPAHGEITRRDLATYLLPHHEIIPAIIKDDCSGSLCKLCSGFCAAGAILDSDKGLIIDESACNGCGACVNVCPHGAISYPGYSTAELEREIDGLLTNDTSLPNRILAITCNSWFNADSMSPKTISAGMFTIKVPSLTIVSPLLLLHALNAGADGIVFIQNEANCKSHMQGQSLNDTISFVQKLLDRWGIDSNRIGYINKVDSNSSKVHSELCQFANKIIALGHTPFKTAAGSMTFEGMYSLAAIIKEMDAKLRLSQEGLISGVDVPFGIVTIDHELCSGCRVCAQTCPTGALTAQISGDSSNLKLMFQHSRCIACELCTGICPEKCIESRKVLDFSRLSDIKETIFENDFVICRKCSKPYATKSMIDILKQKLEKAGVFSTEWTEYCPLCRVSIQQKR